MAIRRTLTAGAAGAALAYFLDPQLGRARRVKARDMSAGMLRRVMRRGERAARHAASDAAGAVERVMPRLHPEHDDVTLAERIRNDVLRELDRSRVNVNVEGGVAVLRGTLDDEGARTAIVNAIRNIPGIMDVRDLVHAPGTRAQTNGAMR
ncbi:MAG: BON domain-containing protein [Actinomycetota bacterium]